MREDLAAIRSVASPRQWRITLLWLLNFTRAEMAKQIGIAPGTLRYQISRLRAKRLPLAARNIVSLL